MLVGAITASTSAVASAHAILLATSPGAGEVLAAAPSEISLRFSEPVELSAGAVRVLDTFGNDVEVGRPRHAPGDDAVVVVDVPTLANGGYAVGWKVVSADGHPIDGAFTFAIGNTPQPGIDTLLRAGERVGVGAGWAGTGLSVARAAVYAGLALLLGGWMFLLTCWWDGRRDRALGVVVAIGGGLVAVASLARVWLQARYVDASVGDIWHTSTARAWIGAAIAGIVVSLVALGLRGRSSRRAQGATLAVGAIVLGFLVAHGGHGAVGRWAAAAVVLTVVHVAAMAAWTGGLVSLLVCVRRATPHDARAASLRFSRLALASVGALMVTGTVQGLRQIESLGAIGDSAFGRTLIVKLAIVALLLIAAIASQRIVGLQRPVDDSDAPPSVLASTTASRLRRSVAIEVVFALAAIGATGQLAGASPLVDRTGTVDVALVSGDQIAYVTITPALTGVNQIHVSLASTSGTVLAPAEITLELSPDDGQIPPIEVPVVLIPPAHITADTTAIPFAGRWHLEVTARYGDFRLVTFETDFTVD